MSTVTAREQAKAIAVAEFLAPEVSGASGGGDSSGLPTAPTTPSTGTPGITGNTLTITQGSAAISVSGNSQVTVLGH